MKFQDSMWTNITFSFFNTAGQNLHICPRTKKISFQNRQRVFFFIENKKNKFTHLIFSNSRKDKWKLGEFKRKRFRFVIREKLISFLGVYLFVIKRDVIIYFVIFSVQRRWKVLQTLGIGRLGVPRVHFFFTLTVYYTCMTVGSEIR